jgi:ABC-type transporter MlaC component
MGRLVWLLVVSLLALPASAETIGERARRVIEVAYTEMNAGALRAKTDDDARSSARLVLGRVLDYGVLARAALGPSGPALSAEGLRRYDGLFRALLEARLTRLFRAGRAATFSVLGVEAESEHWVVRTAVDDGKSRVRFDHVFLTEGTSLRIVDIVIDGYSQVSRYRQVFARWHRRGGESYLLSKLSDSVARAQGGAAEGAP